MTLFESMPFCTVVLSLSLSFQRLGMMIIRPRDNTGIGNWEEPKLPCDRNMSCHVTDAQHKPTSATTPQVGGRQEGERRGREASPLESLLTLTARLWCQDSILEDPKMIFLSCQALLL